MDALSLLVIAFLITCIFERRNFINVSSSFPHLLPESVVCCETSWFLLQKGPWQQQSQDLVFLLLSSRTHQRFSLPWKWKSQHDFKVIVIPIPPRNPMFLTIKAKPLVSLNFFSTPTHDSIGNAAPPSNQLYHCSNDWSCDDSCSDQECDASPLCFFNAFGFFKDIYVIEWADCLMHNPATGT